MLSEPKVERRTEQHYLAIRTKVNMNDIPAVLPPLADEVIAWLKSNEYGPGGTPFFNYLSIDENNDLVAEVGVIVPTPMKGDGHIVEGIFPAGNYLFIMHTGDYMYLKEAHMALVSWISKAGVKEKGRIDADVTEWGSRTEFYLTDEQKEPNPDKWQTEVAFLLEDEY